MIRLDAHRDEQHRDQQWHKPVRVAATGSVTIATALNAGDSLDGVTLVAGDRVLLPLQSAGAENGIYVVSASPVRAYDMLVGIQALGAVVRVLEGTANGDTWWQCTNTALPTIDTTALTWEEVTFGSSGITDHHDLTGLALAGDHDWAAWSYGGGRHVIAVIPDAGASETLDLETANVFDIGLSTGCTLSFSNPPADGTAGTWQLVFSGSQTLTWPGSVVWLDGDGTAPDAAATLVVFLETIDGGTTYLASAGRGEGVTFPLSDDTPLIEAGLGDPGVSDEASRADHVHPLSSTGGVGPILIADIHSTPIVFEDFLLTEEEDDLLYADAS